MIRNLKRMLGDERGMATLCGICCGCCVQTIVTIIAAPIAIPMSYALYLGTLELFTGLDITVG